jgi:hypothetical protein
MPRDNVHAFQRDVTECPVPDSAWSNGNSGETFEMRRFFSCPLGATLLYCRALVELRN